MDLDQVDRKRQAASRPRGLGVDEIMRILIDGGDDDRYELLEPLHALPDPDRSEIRLRLMHELDDRFAPRQEFRHRNPALVPSIRGWLISALSAVIGNDDQATETLIRHTDSSYEPDELVRYWTLANLHWLGYLDCTSWPLASKV